MTKAATASSKSSTSSRQAWTEERFSYKGRFHSFENVRVVPKPYQKPLPEIRIAASTPDTFPAIGALGYPVFASTRHPTWTDLAPHIKAYYDAYKAAGHPGKGQVYVSAPIYIAETEERAREEARESVTHFYRLQYELIAEFGAPLRPAEFHRPRRETAHPDL